MPQVSSIPLIRLQNISKSFASTPVLKDISLEIVPGEILALLGRSGCGKSTLIKILVGYHAPSSGKVFFKEQDITKNFTQVREQVGYVTQDNSFYEKLTVLENMYYYGNLYTVPTKELKERTQNLLKAIKLEHAQNTLAGDISGGMKRRLDFAISLLHDPTIVVLDEPTTGLDPLLVEEFWKIVTTIVKERHIAVLVSSHLLTEVEQHCSKAAFLKQGHITKLLTINAKTNLNTAFNEYT